MNLVSILIDERYYVSYLILLAIEEKLKQKEMT